MKNYVFLSLMLLLATITSAQTIPVTFAWDASVTPSTTENPIKYKLCLSPTAPATWPAGTNPTDRICAETGPLLEWKFDMTVGTRYVFATAYYYGMTVDGAIDTTKFLESGPSNVLRIEVFAPPGRPDKVRIKTTTVLTVPVK
jgi:hypothetical protein